MTEQNRDNKQQDVQKAAAKGSQNPGAKGQKQTKAKHPAAPAAKAQKQGKEARPAAAATAAGPEVQLEKPKDPSNHWIFMDVCKVVAVLFIVVMHVSAGPWGSLTPDSFSWHTLNVFNCLSRLGMPLFFMQVGAVYLNKKNDMSIKTLYKTHILLIITAFFIWSAVYMVSYYIFDAPGGFGDFTLGGFIEGFLAGAPYSQWFIILAISLYMIIPILKMVVRDMTVCKYFLLLWGIFSLALPLVYKLPVFWTTIPASLSSGLIMVADTFGRISPAMVVGFPGYMVLGYYLHNTEFSKKTTFRLVLLGVAAIVFMVAMTVYISVRSGSPSELLFDSTTLNVFLMAVAVMVGMQYVIRNVWFGPKTYKILRFFSNVSFGIFLIHDFIRMGLVRLGVDALVFPPLISVPLLSVLVFALSGGFAYVLMNIPKIGPFIVGGK